MKRLAWAAVLAALTHAPAAPACSCAGPELAALIAPHRVDDAPLNTTIRVAVAARGQRTADEPTDAVLELRTAAGELVPTRAIITRTEGSWIDHVDLVPAAPLRPHESYVVSYRAPSQWPDTHVLGAFRTGTTADTTAPELAPLGAPTLPPTSANGNMQMQTSCSTSSPWVRFDVTAHDPDRRHAVLSYAVWLGDPKGHVDVTAPPTSILRGSERSLTIGRSSSCSPQAFPWPTQGSHAWLAIAAIDDAGNRSPVQKVRVPIVGTR